MDFSEGTGEDKMPLVKFQNKNKFLVFIHCFFFWKKHLYLCLNNIIVFHPFWFFFMFKIYVHVFYFTYIYICKCIVVIQTFKYCHTQKSLCTYIEFLLISLCVLFGYHLLYTYKSFVFKTL